MRLHKGEGADDAEGHVPVRVPGLLGGDGHHVEAQEGEKDQGGGLNDAPAAVGHQGQPVVRPDEAGSQDQDEGDHRQLDHDQCPWR